MKNDNLIIRKYRNIAVIGIILMGIGSFMSCLSVNNFAITFGTILLCGGLVLSIIGFSKWQP